jgi:predicted RNA-binding protein with TRAM domain
MSSNYSGRRYGGGGGGRNFGRDRGFGGSGEAGPKPVEVGKEYDVQISEISRQGDGIARVQGFVIFVKGGKVGEKTKIRILNVGPRFATAQKAEPTTAAGQQQQQQEQLEPSQPSSSDNIIETSGPRQVAPPLNEQEKPELQDYKSNQG